MSCIAVRGLPHRTAIARRTLGAPFAAVVLKDDLKPAVTQAAISLGESSCCSARRIATSRTVDRLGRGPAAENR